MSRNFDIPFFYRSPIISVLKQARRTQDRYKKDLKPTVLDFGDLVIKLGRHFGFCFGVENAIDIAYRALKDHPGKRVFLLSEMIHNPHVNEDLKSRGVRFIMQTDGTQLIALDELKTDDVVIIPAFGTTTSMLAALQSSPANLEIYNTTCPFVEKVWNRSAQIGKQGYTVIIHGRHNHEETRATFSHADQSGPCLIVKDIQEARILAEFISGQRDLAEFDQHFKGLYSNDFNPVYSLEKIGVVNQTTMLASETREIASLLADAITRRYGQQSFADTNDTLCYATNENQDATLGLIEAGADLAIVVGGYNSSNTSHLVELLEKHMPAWYIKDSDEILDRHHIRHLNIHTGQVEESSEWLPEQKPIQIVLTSGASCPDALVDAVIVKVCSLFGLADKIESVLEPYKQMI